MAWKLFLGGAAHRLIAYMYGVKNPGSQTYNNSKSIQFIVENAKLGDTSRLLADEYKKCPDITDVTRRVLFEIKPWHEQGLQEGREKARMYLAALNRTILAGRRFTGGTDFQGEVLIRFARGQYIWRLEGQTEGARGGALPVDAQPGALRVRGGGVRGRAVDGHWGGGDEAVWWVGGKSGGAHGQQA
jgi:hypothetical protein